MDKLSLTKHQNILIAVFILSIKILHFLHPFEVNKAKIKQDFI